MKYCWFAAVEGFLPICVPDDPEHDCEGCQYFLPAPHEPDDKNAQDELPELPES